MLHLQLSAPLSLTAQQWRAWQSSFDESVAFEELAGTVLDPLELTLELHGRYEPDDVTAGLVAAFASIGITQGCLELALSEHDQHDLELEAPPFYESVLDLARTPEPVLAQVQVELTHAVPYTPAELAVLERELRGHMAWPVTSFVAVSPSIKGRHLARLELVAMPEAQLPSREELKASTEKALAAARFKPLRVKVGAYVGTWDNTLFDDTW